MNTNSIAVTATVVAVMLAAQPIRAQQYLIENPSIYIGGGAGLSTIDLGIDATTGTIELDEDDVGYKFFGGINLNRILSIEGFYANLGEATITGNTGDTITGDGETVTVLVDNLKITVSATTFGFTPVFGFALTEFFRPFAKIGAHFWDGDVSATSSAGSFSVSDSGIDMVYGGGFLLRATDNIAIRAEFERFEFDDDDVDFISGSLQFTF